MNVLVNRVRGACLCLAAILVVHAAPAAQASAPPVVYSVTFPAPEHHWFQVAVTFTGLDRAPLRVHMSRSSPGRYSVHEFAKNIFALDATDGGGRALTPARVDADAWEIAGHDGTVQVVYKIFGDYADGTYLGIDTTHAHINMPAAFLWGEGLDLRPIRITFTPPAGLGWTVATQLFPTSDPWTFTAPNLQYFMDSPTELAHLTTTSFTVPQPGGPPGRFRVAAHSDGSQADVDALGVLVARLVREEMAVYGEFPAYETGQYTFLLDYVPWGEYDGMEHRNSTSISVPDISLRTPQGRQQALETIAHEFFHSWNVERIRPEGLEPFDLTRENVTCCLWLAEGFTQYYGPLLLTRAGLADSFSMSEVATVLNSPARTVRSAVGMSQEAPFADASVEGDRDDRSRTFLDYYTYGSAIALGLDLSLREMSSGRISLDDYMRRLWQDFGKPADPRPGYVAKPYTLADLTRELADVSGNAAFANDFFARYVEGRETLDYAKVLAPAGYTVHAFAGTQGWIGNEPVYDTGAGLFVGSDRPGAAVEAVPFDTPLYRAGVDEGDEITAIDGRPASLAAWSAIAGRRPGEVVRLAVRRRDGTVITAAATLVANPRVAVVPIEMAGGVLTDAERSFRAAWLGTNVH